MITPFIVRALLEEKSVIISGFGAFSVHYHPSRIKDDIVFPPQNIVEFDYSKEADGFNFVSKLSQWKQIRIDEAQTEIMEWVNLLEKGVENNKTVFYYDFGAFSKEPTGRIVFQGITYSQHNIENEGFEPIILPLVENIFTDKPKKDKRDVLANKRRKREWVWFSISIAVPIILLLGLFYKEHLFNLFLKKIVNEVIIDTSIIPMIAEFDSNNEEVIEDISDEPKENVASKFVLFEETNDIYVPFQEGFFYVIAGSFAKEEDALRHIQQKKLEKYNAKIVIQPANPRYRVCIGVFDNEKNAVNCAALIDNNYWVLK
ncbi:MAG: SPOR domain-containing protein [Bacteroidales bacterium]|jgi:nucleoid DNA-binding protein|nr:SPOR domain-containing protein [Bacteroidales bacterium]